MWPSCNTTNFCCLTTSLFVIESPSSLKRQEIKTARRPLMLWSNTQDVRITASRGGASDKMWSNLSFRLRCCRLWLQSSHDGSRYGSFMTRVANERGPLGPAGTGFDAVGRSVHFSPAAWSRRSGTWWHSAGLASLQSCQIGEGCLLGWVAAAKPS